MAEFRYGRRAADELLAQVERIGSESPAGARSVVADIEHVLDLLASGLVDGPFVGSSRTVRRAVTPRFGYHLTYVRRTDGVEVLSIRHPRQRPFTSR